MLDLDQLNALFDSQQELLLQARLRTALSRHLIKGSRERVARSLALLDRTRAIAARYTKPGDGVHFTPPIFIDDTKKPAELRTVSELIAFIQHSGKGTSILGSEIFVAATLPSPERLRGIRAAAVANFRSVGVRVH